MLIKKVAYHIHCTTRCALLIFFSYLTAFSAAQNPYTFMNASQLRQAVAKLQVLGSALYIGAHPDDENTGLIAYLAQDRLYETAYLSLTRGDGGQNLIGSEQAEHLGLIRTQELLAARRIDGGQQFFTRAIDFGFSKSAKETLSIWDREQVLADMVWIIRRFQPDVIISRFQTGGEAGHGHHSASSILAEEAYHAAADTSKFPEQLRWVQPWQARRLLWNGWRLEESKSGEVVAVEVGRFNPLLGKSYTEIAGESRSMHKSQGFGSAERRGSRKELFKVVAGASMDQDIFDQIDTQWTRVHGGERMVAMIKDILQRFQDQNPSASLPALLTLKKEMDQLPAGLWVERKRQELDTIIRMAAGVWLEATADDYRAVPGQPLSITASVVKRTEVATQWLALRLPWQTADTLIQQPLLLDQPVEVKIRVQVPMAAAISQPYWLTTPASKGMYQVEELTQRGIAEPLPSLSAEFSLMVNDTQLRYSLPVVFRWTDPVAGETYRQVVIAPAVTLALDQPIYLFVDDRPRTVRVRLHNQQPAAGGTVRLQLPAGWRCQPVERPFHLSAKDDEQELLFQIQAPVAAAPGRLIAQAQLDNSTCQYELIEIRYPHIPIQTFFQNAAAQLVRLENSTLKRKIGYIMGSGDDIPELLKQMGFQVTLLSDQDLLEADFSHYETLITGVRAYNTRPRLAAVSEKLNQFVAKGGVLLVQYNTPMRLVTEKLGPWPLRISRDRVTDENARVTRLVPDHPLFNMPFRIDDQDFNGWVQERGLYFADQWDSRYQPLLSCHDAEEKDKLGGMLVGRYGKGLYIFSSYAWFRQLPAGVPGAYRLFLNMILAR